MTTNNNTAQKIVVLGAADPEMNAIETACRAAGWRVAYATVGGKRCHGGNAYKADGFDMPDPSAGFDEVILVECDFPEGFFWITPPKVIRIDHHRPGDPGYGKGPEEFLAASSLGQVFALLCRDGNCAVGPVGASGPLTGPEGFAYLEDDPDEGIGGWFYRIPFQDGTEAARTIGGSMWSVPTYWYFTAAADHCLEAAYRGKCTGVDPDDLMKWRAESRAAFQKRTVGEVLADVEEARRRLRENIILRASIWGDGTEGEVIRREYADFRGETPIPELPEAACREGIAYLADVTEPTGRKKVVLGAAQPDLVRRFLAGEIVHGLTGEKYGDPSRGMAGWYVTS